MSLDGIHQRCWLLLNVRKVTLSYGTLLTCSKVGCFVVKKLAILYIQGKKQTNNSNKMNRPPFSVTYSSSGMSVPVAEYPDGWVLVAARSTLCCNVDCGWRPEIAINSCSQPGHQDINAFLPLSLSINADMPRLVFSSTALTPSHCA